MRGLRDLAGIGPAMLRDFEVLGVETVEQLSKREPDELYQDLCRLTGKHHDICCLDVFTAAIKQARDPNLPVEQRNWWYWSRVRKAAAGSK
jgi:nucleotidyltransferase/DNA polymerase involved in DNA repair